MWLRAWAGRDGCGAGPRQTAGTPGLAASLWPRCPSGVTVTGDLLSSGGHTWFGSIGAAAGDLLLYRFFTGHRLRPAPARWEPSPDPAVPIPAGHKLAVGSIRVFRLPQPDAEPFDIAAATDGSVWFTEFAADKIGRISPGGVITQFKVPTAGAGPYQISAGTRGTMWFTEYNTTKIGRVSPAGHIEEFQIPRPSYGGTAMTASGTGSMFAADPAGFIDVISPAGAITRIKVPSALGLPFALTRLRSGRIWLSELTGFYEFSRHLLSFATGSGRPSLTITLPNRLSNIVALTAGPDQTVWFADFGAGDVGEVHPDGRISLFNAGIGAPLGGLSDLTAGPDGSMWFSEQDGIVGRVSPGGQVTGLTLSPPDGNLGGIATAGANRVWVTETGRGTIAELTLTGAP